MTARISPGDYDQGKALPIMSYLESLRLQASSMVASMQSRVSLDTIRPLPVFLGLNSVSGFCLSAGAFTPPTKKVDKASAEKIKSRVQLNFTYFLSNYFLVAVMTAIVVALMHPSMIFSLAIVYGLWMLHGYLIRNELVAFGIQFHALLSVQQRFYVLFVVTTLVVIFNCLVPAIVFCAISGFLILSHAFLRDPKHIDSMGRDDYDEEGGGLIQNDDEGGSESMDRASLSRGDVI